VKGRLFRVVKDVMFWVSKYHRPLSPRLSTVHHLQEAPVLKVSVTTYFSPLHLGSHHF
jgi:hypothetical protein